MSSLPPRVNRQFIREFFGVELDPQMDPFLILDRDLAAIAHNQNARTLLGYGKEDKPIRWKQIEAALLESTVLPIEISKFCRAFAEDPHQSRVCRWEILRPVRCTLELTTLDPIDEVSAAGMDAAHLWVLRDVTVDEEAAKAHHDPATMEALGRVTGGFAHDFNNILAGIHGHMSLLELKLQDPLGGSAAGMDPEIAKSITYTKEATTRAATIVQKLLGYASSSLLQRAETDLNTTLLEACATLRDSIPDRIRISIDLEDDSPWMCDVDPDKVRQVIINLASNAFEAIDGRGEINLSTRNFELQSSGRRHPLRLAEGDYVVISIKDNGLGMDDETQARLFEPFYSTKNECQGTGLGLSTAQGIVRQHGGAIDFTSFRGEGSVFNIYLPSCHRGGHGADVQNGDACKKPEEHRKERILIVDDDAAVRTVAECALSRSGYEVTTAKDGREALEIIRENGAEIDLILSDLNMPELSGKETFKRLKEEGCPIPVIICSGFLLDMEQFAKETGGRPAEFLQKPFELDRLVSSVSTILQTT